MGSTTKTHGGAIGLAGPRTGIPPFQRFLEEQRTPVYRFLVATVGPEEADDCFQETFLAALRAYSRLRSGENLRSWILTIATRKAIDAARGRGRRPRPAGAAQGLPDAVSPDGAEPTVDRTDPLWAAVMTLPPRQRAAVVHRFVLDRTYADVAEALGCSEQAARANVYQALKKLRGRWDHANE